MTSTAHCIITVFRGALVSIHSVAGVKLGGIPGGS